MDRSTCQRKKKNFSYKILYPIPPLLFTTTPLCIKFLKCNTDIFYWNIIKYRRLLIKLQGEVGLVHRVPITIQIFKVNEKIIFYYIPIRITALKVIKRCIISSKWFLIWSRLSLKSFSLNKKIQNKGLIHWTGRYFQENPNFWPNL